MLSERLGVNLNRRPDEPTAETSPAPGPRGAAAAEPEPAAPAAASGPDDPTPEITGLRWSGSLLLRDLRINGTVSGSRIAAASVTVTDTAGREIKKFGSLPEVATHLASSADPAAMATIAWRVKVDGKRLLLAQFPLTVTVVVSNTAGESKAATTEVAR